MGFAPTCLRQVSPPPLHMTTLTTVSVRHELRDRVTVKTTQIAMKHTVVHGKFVMNQSSWQFSSFRFGLI